MIFIMRNANNFNKIYLKGHFNMKNKLNKKPKISNENLKNFPSRPKTVFDAVNMYGTFNIQKTADTENEFPMISQGLPKSKNNTQNEQ